MAIVIYISHFDIIIDTIGQQVLDPNKHFVFYVTNKMGLVKIIVLFYDPWHHYCHKLILARRQIHALILFCD